MPGIEPTTSHLPAAACAAELNLQHRMSFGIKTTFDGVSRIISCLFLFCLFSFLPPFSFFPAFWFFNIKMCLKVKCPRGLIPKNLKYLVVPFSPHPGVSSHRAKRGQLGGCHFSAEASMSHCAGHTLVGLPVLGIIYGLLRAADGDLTSCHPGRCHTHTHTCTHTLCTSPCSDIKT